MNLLVTGCNGFLGREFAEYFNGGKYNLFLTSRNNLDICDIHAVRAFFERSKIDVVLHCAARGGKRNSVDTEQDFIDNIYMFDNLKRQKRRFKLLINFASGAEFNRALGVDCLAESQLSYRFPIDYYGMSKRIVAKNVSGADNMVNLRLFGCFGPKEDASRLVKTAIARCLKNEQTAIEENKEMDFFYVGDLCKVVELYIQNFGVKTLPMDVNMCYSGKKQTLKDVAELVYAQKNMPGQVIVKGDKMGKPYTGSGKILQKLALANGIEFDGLSVGVAKTFLRLT